MGLGRDAHEESVGGEAGAGDRGVAHEGEDDPEVSGLEVCRQSLHGPRARSAEVAARRRPEEELQAEVCRVAHQEEGPRRPEEGRREGRHPLHRHRPRSRRRGDRLAPRRRARRRQEERVPDHLQRDHRARRQGGIQQPRKDRPEESGRSAGAARAGPPRRLQPLAPALGEGPARPLGRPRAVGGGAADRRPGARGPGVCSRRVLVAPRATQRRAATGVRGDAEGDRRREGVAHQRGNDARAHGVARRRVSSSSPSPGASAAETPRLRSSRPHCSRKRARSSASRRARR